MQEEQKDQRSESHRGSQMQSRTVYTDTVSDQGLRKHQALDEHGRELLLSTETLDNVQGGADHSGRIPPDLLATEHVPQTQQFQRKPIESRDMDSLYKHKAHVM